MKTNRSIRKAGLVLFACILSVSAWAQPGGGPGGGRGFQMTEDDIKERVATTAENLELSDEQHKKILDYELEFFNKMQVERQKMMSSNERPDRETMRAQMTKMREERDANYASVLTEAQMKKWKELQEQRRGEMRQQRQENADDGESSDRPARGRGRN